MADVDGGERLEEDAGEDAGDEGELDELAGGAALDLRLVELLVAAAAREEDLEDDRDDGEQEEQVGGVEDGGVCLLYTSDAADEG